MPADFQLDWIELSAEQIKLRCREAGLQVPAAKWECQAQYLTFLLEKVLHTQPAADFEWPNILRRDKVRPILPAGCGQGRSLSLATAFAIRTDPQCQGQYGHRELILARLPLQAHTCCMLVGVLSTLCEGPGEREPGVWPGEEGEAACPADTAAAACTAGNTAKVVLQL